MLTVYGIETLSEVYLQAFVSVATALTVYGIETKHRWRNVLQCLLLQQHLPFTVCAAECEAAEEQSDDEVRTSKMPE